MDRKLRDKSLLPIAYTVYISVLCHLCNSIQASPHMACAVGDRDANLATKVANYLPLLQDDIDYAYVSNQLPFKQKTWLTGNWFGHTDVTIFADCARTILDRDQCLKCIFSVLYIYWLESACSLSLNTVLYSDPIACTLTYSVT